MSELRVYQVISGDLWAGAENQCHQLCSQMHKSGVQVYPVLFNYGELSRRLQSLGLPVLVWDENTVSTFGMIRRARSIVTSNVPAVIHTHGPKEAFIFGVAKILMRSHIKIIRTNHGAQEHQIPLFDFRRQIIFQLKNWADKYLIDHIIAVSPGLECALLNSNRTDKITTIVNAIDCDHLTSADDPMPGYECRPKNLRLGMFARLVNVKRHDLAIKALSLIDDLSIENFDHIELHIFGDGALASSLTELSQALDLGDRITFHGFTSKVSDAMRSIDAMLMPSDHEGTPMALLESMALGIPVIGHDVGGIKDILSFTGQGILVKQHDAQGYADAIMKLCRILPDLNNNKERALIKFRERYNIDNMCTQHVALYERLISQSRS